MVSRTGKLQPWYHATRPRCTALIGRDKEQCLFSASYTDTEGKGIDLCKTHADMVKFKVKRIQAKRITLR